MGCKWVPIEWLVVTLKWTPQRRHIVKAFPLLFILVGLASFMVWHVVYWLCTLAGVQHPEVVAWVLAVPLGTWVVFK